MMSQYLSGGALEEEEKEDHRALPRSGRKYYRHAQAKACINRDYLGPDALFGADFPLQFAISRPRFQKLMEDIAATGNPGYAGTLNDKTILRMSPLLESMIDGTFEELETEAELVPF